MNTPYQLFWSQGEHAEESIPYCYIIFARMAKKQPGP